MNTVVQKFVEYLFPQRCVRCRNDGGFLCDRCNSSIEEKLLSKEIVNGLTIYALFQEHIDRSALQLTQLLKYNFCTAVESAIAMMLQRRKIEFPENAVLIPIPLHARRLAWRGFNQSRVLASLLSNHYKVPFEDVLIRRHYIRPQVGLSRAARTQNILNAFSIRPGILLSPQKTYYLIDDVVTTGSTMGAAAAELMTAGAKTVRGLAIVKAA